jgi:hypothetical protein
MIAELQRTLAKQEMRAKAEKERLERTMADLQRAVAEQKLQNQAFLASTSWRLTAPLRGAITRKPALRHASRRVLNAVKDFDLRVRAARVGGIGGAQSKMADVEVAAFFQEGFIGPIDVFTKAQCELIVRHNRLGAKPVSPEWPKTRAVADRVFYDLACRPALLERLRTLLGDDIMLWGASVIERDAGRTHAWHVDIESSAPDARCVSVWIGLENTSRESALKLVARSHRFGKPVQQEVYERGRRRG